MELQLNWIISLLVVESLHLKFLIKPSEVGQSGCFVPRSGKSRTAVGQRSGESLPMTGAAGCLKFGTGKILGSI